MSNYNLYLCPVFRKLIIVRYALPITTFWGPRSTSLMPNSILCGNIIKERSTIIWQARERGELDGAPIERERGILETNHTGEIPPSMQWKRFQRESFSWQIFTGNGLSLSSRVSGPRSISSAISFADPPPRCCCVVIKIQY